MSGMDGLKPIVEVTVTLDSDWNFDVDAVVAAASEFCAALEDLGYYPVLRGVS